jgi:hypothetical protein
MTDHKRVMRTLTAGLVFSSLLVLMISGCFPGSNAGFSYQQATDAAAAETVSFLATQFSGEQKSTDVPTPTLQPTTPVPELTETASPTPLLQPTAETPTATSAQLNTCDVAGYRADMTIGDGMSMPAGTRFTKTWRLANDGSCTWTSAYRLVFVSGEAMTTQTSIPITAEDVPPGGVIEVSVDMKAPSTEGEHAGFWKLENAQGERFGITEEGKSFWVRIVVAPLAKATLAVTSVKVYSEYTGWSGYCGKSHTANFSAIITANTAGRVLYHWDEKSGWLDDTIKKLDFVGPGSMTVTTSFDFKKPYYEGYVTITIDEPNHQTFDKVRYTITCTDK